MQERNKEEKRQGCCVACGGLDTSVKPIDIDVDFEGLAIAWKQVNESSERRR